MKKTIFMLFLLTIPFLLRAQGLSIEGKGSAIGIKSNIPYWATATFNLGAEVYLARHWTLELEAGLNPFSGKNDDGSYGRSLKHLRLHAALSEFRFPSGNRAARWVSPISWACPGGPGGSQSSGRLPDQIGRAHV